MYSKLLHKDVFMPKGVKSQVSNLQRNIKKYVFSEHMKGHLKYREDLKHDYIEDIVKVCIESLKKQPRDAFEVELSKDRHFFGKSGWFVTKYCCRIPYDKDNDLVIAIRPFYNKETKKIDFSKNKIVTAWINNKLDNHCTLNKSKYCSLDEWNAINTH